MYRKNMFGSMFVLYLLFLGVPSVAHHEFCHSGPDVHTNLQCDGGEISIEFGDVRGFWEANEESKVKARVIKLFKERFNHWNKESGYKYDVVEKCDASATYFRANINLSRLSENRFALFVTLSSKEYPYRAGLVTEVISMEEVDVYRYFDCYFLDVFYKKYWWDILGKSGGWEGYCKSYFSAR